MVHIGDDWPIAVDGADVNANLVIEVLPPRALCQMLLASSKAVKVVMPTYTWE